MPSAFEPATVDILVARTHFYGKSTTSMLLRLGLEGVLRLFASGRHGGNTLK
jgi:hypothetical protein